MIKVSSERTVRETTALYEYNDGEELKIGEIRVLYYSPTVADAARETDEIEAKEKAGEKYWLSEALAKRIHSLPELADAKGKPLEITPANLELITIKNLQSIRDAIETDLSAGK